MHRFKKALLGSLVAVAPFVSFGQQVFNTDVIIVGSVCVGFDCITSGENFGFDTQRFKENNLRLHFDDTSNSASFPDNDWRIIINDSDNGGTSHFSIEDATAGNRPLRIEAGAGANALVIENGGDVGINTLEPVVDLHIAIGNTPTVRLDQDASSGFTQQSWDIAGNEANFFIRDVTNGSSLPFRIKPGAATNSFFIHANGNVTLDSSTAGEATNDEKLLVEGNIATTGALHFKESNNDVYKVKTNAGFLRIEDTNAGNDVVVISQGAVPSSIFLNEEGISFLSNQVIEGVYANGNLTVNGNIRALSDRRIKKDIKELGYGLNEIMQLNAKEYLFTSEAFNSLNLSKNKQIGLIAQEVEQVLPELVANDIKAENNDGEITSLKGVNYTSMIPVLIKAIQEQQAIIESRDEELSSLKAQLAEINRKVDALIGNIPQREEQQVSKPMDTDSNAAPIPVAAKSTDDEKSKLDNGRAKDAVPQKKEGSNNH